MRGVGDKVRGDLAQKLDEKTREIVSERLALLSLLPSLT